VQTVLITGASGVVGRAIATELRPTCTVIGLVHSDHVVPEVDRVIPCDLTKDRFGLASDVWNELADRVDVVVHSGALTQWGQPPELYQEANVDGTRRVVDLARQAGAPVHFMSTAFVHVIERGQLETLGETNVVTPYIASKLEAERLLLDSGVPCSIWRPTNLVGNSVTGASSQPQIVQRMSDWICRGKAPYLPIHPGNLLDIAPLDMLSVPVARAVQTQHVGGPYWVAYGERAMTAETGLGILVDHARSLGRVLPPMPIVDPTAPLPVPLEEVPPISRLFLKVMIDVSEVTHGCGGVLPSSLEYLQEQLGAPRASDTEAFRLSLRYWARGAAEVSGPLPL
jgi:nucleoside-diphosphate-sugar epimerase